MSRTDDAIASARAIVATLVEAGMDPDADAVAWADTLQGETDALEWAEWLIRRAREYEALVKAADEMLERITIRRARFRANNAQLRQAAATIMEAAAIRKLVRADFTASLRVTPPHAVELDREATPAEFRRETWAPDKHAIRAALLAGERVPGWEISNGGTALAVR